MKILVARTIAVLASLMVVLVAGQRLAVMAYWETHPEEHRAAILTEARYPLKAVQKAANAIVAKRVQIAETEEAKRRQAEALLAPFGMHLPSADASSQASK